jgi:hypothetical protein
VPYVLSDQRDAEGFGAAQWARYREALRGAESRFPPNAYRIAVSDWWYSFSDPGAPHDASLLSCAASRGPDGLERLTVELESAESGLIRLRYEGVTRRLTDALPGRAGGPGQWRYDEFSPDGHGGFLHVIEWSRGPVWRIAAAELIHEYVP